MCDLIRLIGHQAINEPKLDCCSQTAGRAEEERRGGKEEGSGGATKGKEETEERGAENEQR